MFQFLGREKGDRLLLGKGDRFELETEILMAVWNWGQTLIIEYA